MVEYANEETIESVIAQTLDGWQGSSLLQNNRTGWKGSRVIDWGYTSSPQSCGVW